jgi:hypothetical protein
MKQWLVCSTRDGRLSIMTRWSRETMIDLYRDFGQTINTHVVKCFETMQEADEYLEKMKLVNKLIEQL